MLIGSPYVIPDVAILDPLLTLSCPKGLTASVGIDALTHAIEAYVSVKANPMSDIFALSAIKHISSDLETAYSDSDNTKARENIMLGAMEAGIAFGNSSVALVHGMSRPIGAYFHIPHGVSNAALLAVVMDYSYIGEIDRYSMITSVMGEDISKMDKKAAARKSVQLVRKMISKLNNYRVRTNN